jgi:nucleoside phosphorylase
MTDDPDLAWRRVLTAVTTSPQPLTGRQVATVSGVSPTTATRILRQLHDDDLVTSTMKGRSTLWRGTPDAATALAHHPDRSTTRRALFLTALPLETAALRSLLPGSQVRREPNGVRSIESTFVGTHITWELRTVEGGMGNVATAAAAAQSFDNFSPDLILFVGVAGGLKPADQKHGDVVITNRAYNASAGKEATGPNGEPTFLGRPMSERITQELEELAKQVASTMRLHASIKISAVASTEAVLGTADGSIYKRIRENINDCSIVDMESYGVLLGARRVGVPAISVRGISDLVDDKTPGADEHRQPTAAKNAAKVALQLLRDADPADVRPSSLQRPEHVVPGVDGGADQVTALEHESLPANAQPWYAHLQTHDPDRAEQARLGLLQWRRGAISTHASRTVDRPPAWLRTDQTGEGWAMVAAVASTAEAGVTTRAHEEAARRAFNAGLKEAAAYHRFSALLTAQRQRKGQSDDDHEAAILSELESIDLSDSPMVDALRRVVLAQKERVGDNWEPVLAAAADAVSSLGIDLADVGLADYRRRPSDTTAPHHADATAQRSKSQSPSELSQPVRDLIIGSVALQIATLHLYAERGVAALQAADFARRLVPGSANARVRRGQALLTVLHAGPGVQGAGIGRESDVLTEIRRLALDAHATLAEWDGDGAEALALAGRALMESGNPEGALRLLRRSPHGTANPKEAASADVTRIVVPCALMIGDHGLALEAAKKLDGTTEGLLFKAQALERAPGMRSEARDAYLQAIRTRGEDRSTLERALLGIARLGEPLHTLESAERQPDEYKSAPATGQTPSRRQALRSALDDLSQQNPAIADLCIGTAALENGDAELALTLARRHRDRVQGVELAADAYEALGESSKAVEVSWDYGVERGDVAIQLEAMMRAGRQGDFDRVTQYSDTIIRDQTGEPRRLARRARLRAAALTNDWQTVEAQSKLLLDEGAAEGVTQLTDAETTSLRWTRIEALFRLRQTRSAFEVLSAPTFALVTTRDEAVLALATCYSLIEQGAPLAGSTIDWVLTLASTWIEDEEVCRRAVGVLLMSGGDDDLGRISRARDVIERYFERHKENAQIRQIELAGEVDPDSDEIPEGYFDPLYEELKRSSVDRDPALEKLSREVWLGRVPWATFVDILGRNYVATLIQGGTGQHILSSPWARSPAPEGIEGARLALSTGMVAVDPSALVVAPRMGLSRRALLTAFQKVHLAAKHREDMLQARADLGRRNDLSLGWDSRQDRPRATVADPADVESWATESAELCECLPLLSVHSADVSRKDTYGLDSMHLAARLGVPLWADDAAIRAFAREREVPSFTTLDLVEALRDQSLPIDLPTPEDIVRAARDARVVDLPISQAWWELARLDAWQPNRGAALAISRPAAWQDPMASFAQFQTLIEMLTRQPADVATVEAIAAWTGAAAHGLASAVNPSIRAHMTSNLIGWVILRHEPALNAQRLASEAVTAGTEADPNAGRLLAVLFGAMSEIAHSVFPAADSVRELTATLASTIRAVADAPTTMRVMIDAFSKIQDDSLRDAAIKALLTYPPTPSD